MSEGGKSEKQWVDERNNYIRDLVTSPDPKKLVVAGPGAGKTRAFRQVLESKGGRCLVLTFLRKLVADLEERLDGLADVYTFHGYAQLRMRNLDLTGITRGYRMFPLLSELVTSDLDWVDGVETSPGRIGAALRELDEGSAEVSGILRSGDYYDAVGHDDSVYRLFRHLRDRSEDVEQFHQIVVDEYQDFCRLEIEFIELLARESPILIVGDDDQALYDRRQASPDYLRALVSRGDFSRFPLPFCHRCPEVVVAATLRIVQQARSIGRLQARIEKDFLHFPPSKRADSERYPRIQHVFCTVQGKGGLNYMGRYISQKIREIPQPEVEEAQEDGYPAALVIGPGHIAEQVFEFLDDEFPNVEFRRTARLAIDLLEGYQLIHRDPQSRLGWRIVTYLYPTGDMASILTKALTTGAELADLLPEDYKKDHIRWAGIANAMLSGDAVDASDAQAIARLGIDIESGKASDSAEESKESIGQDQPAPSRIVTTFPGSKGLQGAHIFLVGFEQPDFPNRNDGPSDQEICSLIVGLTRTVRQCFIFSCGRLSGQKRNRSIFLDWLDGYLETSRVGKEFWAES